MLIVWASSYTPADQRLHELFSGLEPALKALPAEVLKDEALKQLREELKAYLDAEIDKLRAQLALP